MTRNAPPDIGNKIKARRSEIKLTLDQLAKRSGISKSMLSQIERGLTNPTLAIIWSLTHSLGIDIASLLSEAKAPQYKRPMLNIMKSHQTPEIQSADGKCDLRILGPIDKVSEIEWYELILEPSGLLESEGHSEGTIEHLTLLAGQLAVKNDQIEEVLSVGDTARYQADVPHYIENKGDLSAWALMVVLSPKFSI